MPPALYHPTLEEVQIGIEAAWGDAAVPSVALGGVTECHVVPKIEASQITDKRASTMPAYIAAVNRLSGEATMSGIVTYTQIKYFLDAMFTTDAATPFAYLAALAPAVPATWNLLYGQSGLCYSMAGALMDKLVIRGDTNGPLTYEAHFNGKAPVADAREVLSIPALIIAMGGHVVLSIDAATVAHGTTPLALTGLSFEMAIENSRHPVHHLGTLNPDNYAHGKWGGSLHLVAEMTAATKAYLTAALANTIEPDSYNVRLAATGSGTSALTMDFSGHLLASPELFTEDEGVTTATLDFSPAYDSSPLSCWKFNVVAA